MDLLAPLGPRAATPAGLRGLAVDAFRASGSALPPDFEFGDGVDILLHDLTPDQLRGLLPDHEPRWTEQQRSDAGRWASEPRLRGALLAASPTVKVSIAPFVAA